MRRPVPHQLTVAAGGRGAAPLPDPIPHGRRLLVLRPRRGQGHPQLHEAGAQPARLHRAGPRGQLARARHRQDHHGDAGANRSDHRHQYLGRNRPRHRRPTAARARVAGTGEVPSAHRGRPRHARARLRRQALRRSGRRARPGLRICNAGRFLNGRPCSRRRVQSRGVCNGSRYQGV